MGHKDTIPNLPLTNSELRRPLWPARLSKLGSIRSRRQTDGSIVLFVAVIAKTIYTAVPSMLDGYSSDWYSKKHLWVPFDSLHPGQLEILCVV